MIGGLGGPDATPPLLRATIGRVDGLTSHWNRPEAETCIVVSSVSWNCCTGPSLPWASSTGDVLVSNSLCTRRIDPAGALPSMMEWRAGLTVLSSALKNAARLPPPPAARAVVPRYSATVLLYAGWKLPTVHEPSEAATSQPISNV